MTTHTLMSTHMLQVSTLEDKEPDAPLQSFWELESLGIQESDDLAYNHFMRNITSLA